ncbi:MAG: hypothetical protein KDB74_01610 [Flavobacteriales bacterium]|nr:hypothetical protein [Flavobacteriales bacterium]
MKIKNTKTNLVDTTAVSADKDITATLIDKINYHREKYGETPKGIVLGAMTYLLFEHINRKICLFAATNNEPRQYYFDGIPLFVSTARDEISLLIDPKNVFYFVE